MDNLFLEKTRQGQQTIGTFFEIGGTTVGEIMALTDMDYFIIDGEHGTYTPAQVADIIRAAEGAGRPAPFVRVKDSQRNSILQMLDVGAKGIVVPQIRSVDEAFRTVEYGKYYPVGNRGFAPTRNSLYGCAKEAQGSVQDYFDACNEKQLLILQCETVECLENIETIAAINGVDGIFLGPYDLSIDMGMPAQFDQPDFTHAVAHILETVKAAGKFCIIFAADEKTAISRLHQGFDSVTVSMDSLLYRQALNRTVETIRSCL